MILSKESIKARVTCMYICLCHGVNETTIREAVGNGARTYRELSFQTGCGTQCGSCTNQVQALLVETLVAESKDTSTPFLKVVAAY